MGLQKLDCRGIGTPQGTRLLQKLQRVGQSIYRETWRHQTEACGADVHGVPEHRHVHVKKFLLAYSSATSSCGAELVEKLDRISFAPRCPNGRVAAVEHDS